MRGRGLATFVAAAGAALLVAITGCSTTDPTAVRPLDGTAMRGSEPTYPYGSWAIERTVQIELIEVCKDYPQGGGPDVTFDVAVSGYDNTSFQVTIPAGECREVWLNGGGASHIDHVTVTEQVPSGYVASYVRTTLSGGITTQYVPVVGNSATGDANGQNGALFVFSNTPLPPPPPEGCTLTFGYWKNHPGDWDQLSDPNTASFVTGTTFYNSGKTYLEILKLAPKGGNAYIILAHQFIAAELSVGAGASTTSAVDAALTGAAAYFAGASAGIPKPHGALRDQLITWATVLDDYNNGLIGPGHCAD